MLYISLLLYSLSPMKTTKLKLAVACVAFALASFTLTIAALSNTNYASGQLFQLIGEKIGIVQSDGNVNADTVIVIPVPADESIVPEGFTAPQAQVTASVPAWGDGEVIVEGNATK